jgi:hypothetical protein
VLGALEAVLLPLAKEAGAALRYTTSYCTQAVDNLGQAKGGKGAWLEGALATLGFIEIRPAKPQPPQPDGKPQSQPDKGLPLPPPPRAKKEKARKAGAKAKGGAATSEGGKKA